MAKAKKAQLRYHKKENGQEGYAINILSDGEWVLETWYPLVERKEHGDGETDYVHWGILLKLSNLQQLGYEIDLQF